LSNEVYWTPEDDDKARYAFIRDVLSRFDYPRLVRPDEGLSRAHLEHTSGYSRAQLARLIVDYRHGTDAQRSANARVRRKADSARPVKQGNSPVLEALYRQGPVSANSR
jgi:hypothetical protein